MLKPKPPMSWHLEVWPLEDNWVMKREPSEWDRCPYKGTKRAELSLLLEMIQKDGPIYNQEEDVLLTMRTS